MNAETNTIAAIHFTKGADIDELLLDIATTLAGTGVRIGGLVQLATGGLALQATSVEVIDLFSDGRYQIWEPRGRWAKGCRLDEDGLAAAETAVIRSIHAGIDLLLLNRFGRAESKGRGLIKCFSEGLAEGVPIITAVREPFDAAWTAFHGGLATALPMETGAVIDWLAQVTGKRDVAVSSRQPGIRSRQPAATWDDRMGSTTASAL